MVCGSARSGHAGDLDVQGVVAGRGLWVQGQETWLRGGFGRLQVLADAAAAVDPAGCQRMRARRFGGRRHDDRLFDADLR